MITWTMKFRYVTFHKQRYGRNEDKKGDIIEPRHDGWLVFIYAIGIVKRHGLLIYRSIIQLLSDMLFLSGNGLATTQMRKMANRTMENIRTCRSLDKHSRNHLVRNGSRHVQKGVALCQQKIRIWSLLPTWGLHPDGYLEYGVFQNFMICAIRLWKFH